MPDRIAGRRHPSSTSARTSRSRPIASRRVTRREFGLLTAGAAGAVALSHNVTWAQGEGVIRSHGDSLLGQLKYPADFNRFDYVNPAAPPGGIAKLSASGGFDSFNPFIVKGDAVNISPYVFDTLITPNLEEGSTGYGLVAEWLEHPADYSWVSFRLRDEAHWHDGEPITVADIIFSFNILTEKGLPFYRFYYQNVAEVRDLGDRVVRFDFDESDNRELPHIVGQLPVLPKHWWAEHDFEQSSLERPLGSGPYRLGEFEANRFVEFQRVPDYWGRELPVNVGQYNFDTVRFEYYRDQTAAFEAFKAGDVDFRSENSAKRWATGYEFPAVQRGDVTVREYVETGPKTVQGFVFNLRRERFQDLRVRTVLDLVFDFEWINRTIFYDQYARPHSYFQGTADLMATGAPTGMELELLEELRGQVPDAVFGPAYQPNRTDGSGRIRRELRTARMLLAEAGWQYADGQLVDANGNPFAVEFLTAQDDQLRVVGPYLDNLKRLGFAAEPRVVDTTQYINRVTERDFDMIITGWANSESPGNEQRDYWGSESAERAGSRNTAGVRDPAVDTLVDRIIFAKDRAELAAASRALDRVLTHNRYAVMELFTPFERVAYWNRFGHPDPFPDRSHGFPNTWWWDAERAEAITSDRG